VFHDNFVSFLRNHRRRSTVLRVDCQGGTSSTIRQHCCDLERELTVAVKIGNDMRERLFRLLVQVGNGDTSSEDGVVLQSLGLSEILRMFASGWRIAYRMPSGHVSSGFSSQVVEFDSRDTLVDSIDDAFRNLRIPNISFRVLSRGETRLRRKSKLEGGRVEEGILPRSVQGGSCRDHSKAC
jgi:hypothetical protein